MQSLNSNRGFRDSEVGLFGLLLVYCLVRPACSHLPSGAGCGSIVSRALVGGSWRGVAGGCLFFYSSQRERDGLQWLCWHADNAKLRRKLSCSPAIHRLGPFELQADVVGPPLPHTQAQATTVIQERRLSAMHQSTFSRPRPAANERFSDLTVPLVTEADAHCTASTTSTADVAPLFGGLASAVNGSQMDARPSEHLTVFVGRRDASSSDRAASTKARRCLARVTCTHISPFALRLRPGRLWRLFILMPGIFVDPHRRHP